MKTLVLIPLLISIISCKTVTTKPIAVQAQKTIMYDYRYETGGYFLQNRLHYYKDINTVFIKLAKSKGKGC
jgi:hypothetical protein